MARVRSVLGGAALALFVGPLAYQEASGQTIKQVPARRIESIQGVDTFQAYCAVCHGRDGKGNGPVARALKTVPTDLTSIAKRNGGRFSSMYVEPWILGKDEPTSHGSREMPIWGPVFRSMGSEDVEKLRIVNLIEYLKSIQVK